MAGEIKFQLNQGRERAFGFPPLNEDAIMRVSAWLMTESKN